MNSFEESPYIIKDGYELQLEWDRNRVFDFDVRSNKKAVPNKAEVHLLCGGNVVSISSGKYWTAAVTTTGDVYMWDGKKCKNRDPVLTRLPGIKHVTSACVGETHLLAVCALYHPAYLPALESSHQASILKDNHDIDDLDEELLFSDIQPDISEPFMQNKYEVCKPVPSLKSLCEKVVAEFLVEPRNAIQLLEIADSLEAEDLRKYC
ncbi:hypothetical protein M5K25_003877 [Dendrobium thyrsiflorum]|uniref:Uncharacterized protein n=1 Tax=Dendrobium thyrsiflorum TaxID=117978 RepID=A0ABD0VK79_DENTH